MTAEALLDGVSIVPLRVIPDERGAVLHMLRRDAPHFDEFGEVYFSRINAGAIKGWKLHRRMKLNLCVPSGRVLLALYDDREGSPTRNRTQAIELGEAPEIYRLAIVPPGIWTAFKGLGTGTSLVSNCASLPHDPSEAETRPLDDPPVRFDWSSSPR